MNLSDLTPERRRVMLAEAAGWKPTRETKIPFRKIWIRDDGGGDYWAVDDLPDYDTDLNACHDLEAKLTNEQHRRFRIHLREITCRYNEGGMCSQNFRAYVSAEPHQRASALVLAIYSEINL